MAFILLRRKHLFRNLTLRESIMKISSTLGGYGRYGICKNWVPFHNKDALIWMSILHIEHRDWFHSGLSLGFASKGDSLHVLYKHTHDISMKSSGPIALFSMQVSFVISKPVNLYNDRYKHGKKFLVPEACLWSDSTVSTATSSNSNFRMWCSKSPGAVARLPKCQWRGYWRKILSGRLLRHWCAAH